MSTSTSLNANFADSSQPSDSKYVRYSDDVEQTQPGEGDLVLQTVASFDRVRTMVFDKHRHAVRDARAKSHGVLKGELQIYDGLPPHLAQDFSVRRALMGCARRVCPRRAVAGAHRAPGDDCVGL